MNKAENEAESETESETESAGGVAELRTGKSSPERRAWATHAGLLLVQIAFASQAVEGKLAMLPRALGGEEIFPEALAMIRMIGGALFFQIVVNARATQGVAISRADHARLAGLSILGITANQALFLYGLRWASPFSVSLLGATIPVFTAGLAVLFGKEKIGWRTALGLGLALMGVLSLIGVGSSDPAGALSSRGELGAVLVTLNSLSYAAYVVLSRDVIVRVGALRSVTWLFTYGAISFMPLGLAPMVAQIPALTPRGWVLVLYILALPTIVAYLINAWALGRTSATLVTIYIYLQPLLAGLLAWVQLGLGLSPRAPIAATFILAGLGVVTFRKPAKTAAHSSS